MKAIYSLILIIALTTTKAFTQTQTISIQVTQSSDDAEESEDNLDVLIESSDLELVFDDFSDQNHQTVGIRFTDITIPPNAIIESAYIQFHADDTGDIQTDLTIKGEATAFSQTFVDTPGNISSRNTTTASVNWPNVPAWTVSHQAGIDERTPDISTLITEMISNNNWTYGNPLSFIITGTGSREAESFDGIPQEAPILVINYSVPQVAYDLGIVEMTGIDPYMLVQNEVTITAAIKNHGLNPIDSFSIAYTINNTNTSFELLYQTINPGETYNHVFSETLDLENTGDYTIEITVFAAMDGDIFNNTLTKNFEVIPDFSNIYFDMNSAWKYLDDGSNSGMDWIEENYDDSNWVIGAGEFGFGDGDENTLLNQGSITYYFRKQVDIPDVDMLSNVTAKIASDDALVLYVNGQEISRSFNLPTGTITSTTTPDRDVPHDFENHPVDFNIPITYFNTGINTIAIEVHNLSANDQDLTFNCEFTNQPIDFSMDGPYVIYRENQMLVKNITSNGVNIDTFPINANPTLTCDLPNGDSFSFNLNSNNEIPESQYEMPEKFLVTSDIEGQIEAYIFLLQNTGVIDENYNWIYGEGHLYFIGDMFDRGEYVTQCLWLLYKLEQEAQQVGGQVHFIIGNHEVLNFEHDYRYVRDKYFENSHLLSEMLYDIYDQNTELGQWLRTKNILENAGESAILVHAGLSPQVNNLNLTYDQINDYGRLGMNSNCPSGNTACQIVNGGSDEGVYWYRGIANEELTQNEVTDIVSSFNGETMIFGHTVFPQVMSLYDQEVLVVDVDHGDNFAAGFMEALYFEAGCYFRAVTNSNSLSYISIDPDCIPVNTTELNNAITFDVTPNLFSNNLTIQSGANQQGTIIIHNLIGDLIETKEFYPNQKQQTINTTNWPRGIYIITATFGNQVISEKVIKY